VGTALHGAPSLERVWKWTPSSGRKSQPAGPFVTCQMVRRVCRKSIPPSDKTVLVENGLASARSSDHKKTSVAPGAKVNELCRKHPHT
jgi:hypothetical protein